MIETTVIVLLLVALAAATAGRKFPRYRRVLYPWAAGLLVVALLPIAVVLLALLMAAHLGVVSTAGVLFLIVIVLRRAA